MSSLNTSVEETAPANLNTKIRVFPNPTSDRIMIQDVDNIESIRIFDVGGVLVWQNTYNQASVDVDLSTFAKGVYLIEIINDSKERTIERIIYN